MRTNDENAELAQLLFPDLQETIENIFKSTLKEN